MTNPSFLLADEPTGALDTKTSAEVLNIFTSLNQEGKTIILITHSPDIAKYAKRIIEFRDGEIVDLNDRPQKKSKKAS